MENPFGPELQKYWERRYELFSRFDEGVLIDEEALFSAKPEAFGLQLASRIPEPLVIDAMCGAGGVGISLARSGKEVIAVDIQSAKIDMARRNAELYGVQQNVTFVCDDFRRLMQQLTDPAGIYLDPPWGGPNYFGKRKQFVFADFPIPILDIVRNLRSRGMTVALSLPGNFRMEEMSDAPPVSEVFDTVFFGRRMFCTAVFAPS